MAATQIQKIIQRSRDSPPPGTTQTKSYGGTASLPRDNDIAIDIFMLPSQQNNELKQAIDEDERSTETDDFRKTAFSPKGNAERPGRQGGGR